MDHDRNRVFYVIQDWDPLRKPRGTLLPWLLPIKETEEKEERQKYNLGRALSCTVVPVHGNLHRTSDPNDDAMAPPRLKDSNPWLGRRRLGSPTMTP